MKKTFAAIIVLIIVGAVAYAAAREPASAPQTGEEPAVASYESERYGLSFSYPTTYYLEEQSVGSAQRERYQITLIEDTEWNRRLRSGDVPATEGPTSITVDVFQNNLDGQTAYGFVTGSNDSNYKLGDGAIATTTRGTLEGLEYTWSGLYEGRSFVVARPDYIYMFSVTRLDPTDRILQDFNEVMESVEIE